MPILKQRSRSQSRLSAFFTSPAPEQEPAYTASEDGHLQPEPKPRERSSFQNKLYKAGFARSSDRLSTNLQPPAVQPIQTNFDSNSLPPPPPIIDGAAPHSEASPVRSRPPSSSGTPTPSLLTPVSDGLTNKLKRRSWFGSAAKEERPHVGGNSPPAWIAGRGGEKIPYNLELLLNAERVPELWDEMGNTFIYLFPRTSNKGPSFRIDSSVFSASPVLTRLAFGRVYSESTPHVQQVLAPVPSGSPEIIKRKPVESSLRSISLNDPATPPMTPDPHVAETASSASSKSSRALSDTAESLPSEVHLYLPVALSTDNAIHRLGEPEPKLSADDIETLLGVRNFFAFLVGGSLVGTERNPSIYQIFLQVAKLLEQYEFSNFDGSTFGEDAATSFEKYIDELNLADVRQSREKTIEGIVLGEHMRCWSLYNESYVHGVGKYEEITNLQSPKFEQITSVSRNRMERASMDLYIRQKNINTRLQEFDFPAIFVGVAASKTSDERKVARFDAWKASFMTMRKHVLSYYKSKYGSWPPKANSKKNNLSTSGLNRLVLKDVYHDFSALYDLLADRTNLTTRGADSALGDGANLDDPLTRAMRLVLSEFDRSSPPVQPPIPFDVPLIPTLATTRSDYGKGDEKKDTKARGKKLKTEELQSILNASHNSDTILSPFLDTYKEMERKFAHHRTIDEVLDFRCGAWIFIYAVMQSLPMLVVDAPGVRFTDGVEYFLCEVPRSALPWARDPEASQQRNWYGVAGGTGVVSLPADVVEHGVEGIYRRSHCWEMAEKWTAHSAVLSQAVQLSTELAPPPPPSAPGSGGLLRPASTSGSSTDLSRRRESVMMLGLEALPLPAGVKPDGAPTTSRPGSSRGLQPNAAPVDPSKTFDAILGSVDGGKKKKK